jgi:putative oxidoreductase
MTTVTLTQTSLKRRALAVGLWTLQITSAALFLFAGTLKLLGAPMMVQMFGAIGLGQWFRYFTGGLEVISAVLLLVPSLARFGALTMAVTMVGAILTHLFIIGGNPAVPIALLAATTTVPWVRSRDRVETRADRRNSF